MQEKMSDTRSNSNNVHIKITGWEAHLNTVGLVKFLVKEMNIRGQGNIVQKLLVDGKPICFSVNTYEADSVIVRLIDYGAIFEVKGN